MKTKKFNNNKLILNKKTVANLSDYELNYARGGCTVQHSDCLNCGTDGPVCNSTICPSGFCH